MLDQQAFMETLQSVAEIMRTAETPMTEEEILSYFKDMELSDAQKNMVMDYLNNVENRTEEEMTDGGQTESESDIPAESKVYQMYLEDLPLILTLLNSLTLLLHSLV